MTRDEVICGLEHHATPTHCDGCPYDDDDMECESALMRDALALLEAQEPRVMTLDELIGSYSQETIWFEEKPNHTIKQLTQDGIIALIFIGLLHNWNGYGIVWRCWTSRPTDEQRRTVKWE